MPRTRLPGELFVVIFLCGLLSACVLYLGYVAPDPSTRALLIGIGALLSILTVSLYQMMNWARWVAGLGFALNALIRVIVMALQGFTWRGAMLSFVAGWLAWYLLSASTGRLFSQSRGAKLDPVGIASLVLFLLAVIAVTTVVGMLPVPPWAQSVLVIAVSLVYLLTMHPRLRRGISAHLAPLPKDLDASGRKAFRAARLARHRGDLARARALLAPLPDAPSVRVLKGLLSLDEVRGSGLFRRIILDGDFTPPEKSREEVLKECRAIAVETLVAERADLIDGLIGDAEAASSVFPEELIPTLEKLTGIVFVANEEYRYAEWWRSARPKCTGDFALPWLVARLWEAQCLAAAQDVSRRTEDRLLIEATTLACILDEKPHATFSSEWLAERAASLCLLPRLAEIFGLLQLDLGLIRSRGPGFAANRVRLRLELADRVRRLWEDYGDSCTIEPPWLLYHLTGSEPRPLRARTKFDLWWEGQRAAQERFDRTFSRGLEAVDRDEWEEAQEAFAEAGEAWPERLGAFYNRAIALMRLDRPDEAEPLLVKLTQIEKKEPLNWMRLGDCRRERGQLPQAIEAYEEAARLGGMRDDLALRLGVTLAQDGREEQAEQTLTKALGPNPDPDALEAISSILESEGAFGLAQRYREQAFYRDLGEKDEFRADGDDGEEMAK